MRPDRNAFKKSLAFFLLAAILSYLALAGRAEALIIGSDMWGIDFRFNNPGARANAMGGAFIGLADDATAAYANPAGLTILDKPELSLEYKASDNKVIIEDDRGQTDYKNKLNGASFISFVYPSDKITVAVFQHKLMDINSKFEFWARSNRSTPFPGEKPPTTTPTTPPANGGTTPPTPTDPGTGPADPGTGPADPPGEQTTYSKQKINIEMDVDTYGIGVGVKLAKSFSLGMAVGFDQLDYYMELRNRKMSNNQDINDRLLVINDNDTAEHYTFSCLWNPIGNLNIGAVYRLSPKFNVRVTENQYNETDQTFTTSWDRETKVKLPDSYGLGLSYRFLSNYTVAVDADYVEYSDLSDDVIEGTDGKRVKEVEAPDKLEVHAGFEGAFIAFDIPMALRCGYYYRPGHRFEFVAQNQEFRKKLTAGEDDHIFSLGFGLVPNEQFQLDLAASAGEFEKSGIVSVVYRFK